MTNQLFDFGMIGLGVMGQNFLYNLADHDFKVLGFDKDIKKTTALEAEAPQGTIVKGVNSLEDLVSGLATPRRIMLLVPAGKPVDDVINSLRPLVEPGDVIIDGGNSHYTDTLRRVNDLHATGIHFMGMGVSGGEQGARTGPSIMPGGNQIAWHAVQPILEAVAAKVNGVPCVSYLGTGAAGHYVKMVHNGIEYAIMQLISEAYDILRRGLELSNDELHDVFKTWNEGRLQSFLIEVTRDIFGFKEPDSDQYLIDLIKDQAKSKGTGKWTSQEAMDLAVSIPTIDMAVAMRNLSVYKEERVQAAGIYQSKAGHINFTDEMLSGLEQSLCFCFTIAYAQGLSMLASASTAHSMEIPLADVVQVWKG
ncbi:MAG: NADP-dependent phosphogluconate dehydrogenase, partial [Chitinophagaceae bacterium]